MASDEVTVFVFSVRWLRWSAMLLGSEVRTFLCRRSTCRSLAEAGASLAVPDYVIACSAACGS